MQDKERKKSIHRAKRIEGQIRSVISRMEKGEDFHDLDIQLQAIESAVHSLRIHEALRDLDKQVQGEEKDSLREILARFLKKKL